MWKTSNTLLSNQELRQILNNASAGVVTLDGPSGCGKTSIIKTIMNPSKVIASAELVSLCIEKLKDKDVSLDSLIAWLRRFCPGMKLFA